MENLSKVSNPNLIESQFSKSQNPSKTPTHFTAALKLETPNPSPSLTSSIPTISAASRAFSDEMAPVGTSGSAMAMKEASEESDTESRESEEAAVEMAAAK
jgi:hypothetical protein